ncbi:hypothetical protein [Virgibacillus dokdonensis]|uniref:Uncharacterized protein n=1 Tax=Virgibacillus dokdonensis TaxID=302167 RepID=A0A2K9IZM6_9BACI|nr:hypothetical protein [Virgibacillus dokdonensis]AUJ25172.1 hypothetical protein A21D_02108 [Virgibacillus dokdonensis]
MRVLKSISIFLFTCIVIIVVSAILGGVFPLYSDFFTGIGSTLFSTYIGLKFIILYIYLTDKLELKKYKKGKVEEMNLSLYSWASNIDVDQYYIYLLLNNKATTNPLRNLNNIKFNIKDHFKDNLENYYLFRSYIELHSVNSVMDKVSTFFISLIMAFFTGILAIFLKSEPIVSLLNDFNHQKPDNSKILLDIGPLLTDIFSIMVFIIILIFYILVISGRKKKRLELIKAVLDVLIEEKEAK